MTVTSHEEIRELEKKLREYEGYGGSGPYIVQMWRYGLAHHGQDGPSLDGNEEVDAIPYVPSAVAGLLTGLSSESLVLDIGCLGGYGLYDFAWRRKDAGHTMPRMVGLDIDPLSVTIARDMAAVWAQGHSVRFVEADAASMPIESSTCDLIIARLLLPYVRLYETLSEMRRILKPDGRALLQTHNYTYYSSRLLMRPLELSKAAYCLRAILSGLAFSVLGRQFANRRFSETALTAKGLTRLCLHHGLAEEWRKPNGKKPLLLFKKRIGSHLRLEGKSLWT